MDQSVFRASVPDGYVSVVRVMRGVWTVSRWQSAPTGRYARSFFRAFKSRPEATKLARGMARAAWDACTVPSPFEPVPPDFIPCARPDSGACPQCGAAFDQGCALQ